jgi:hypothetical protein
VVGNNLVTYDANGSVRSSCPRERAVYPATMECAGLIRVDDDFLAFCGEENWEEFLSAVMRHSARMLALGYGDDPEDIVSMFNDLAEKEYMVGSRYIFVGEHGDFRGLFGRECLVDRMEDGDMLVAHMNIGNGMDVFIDNDNMAVSLMISTDPI